MGKLQGLQGVALGAVVECRTQLSDLRTPMTLPYNVQQRIECKKIKVESYYAQLEFFCTKLVWGTLFSVNLDQLNDLGH